MGGCIGKEGISLLDGEAQGPQDSGLTYISICVCMFIFVCVYMYLCVYIHMHSCMYVVGGLVGGCRCECGCGYVCIGKEGVSLLV